VDYHSELITRSDGRQLEVGACGDPAGPTVFFHHGTPGDVSAVRVFEPTARARGYYLVSMSRPGYGLSSRRAGRVAASVVDDTNAALDHYGRGAFISLGWSGGGPHALACAALDRPRCLAAISLAGVAPGNVDFDWTEGMGPENVEEFAMARAGGPAYEEFVKIQRDVLVGATADNAHDLLGGLLSAPDKEALDDPAALTLLAESFAHGLSVSHYGFYDDDLLFLADWGFALDDIDAPVEIWYGDADLMCPPSHGRYLASFVKGATVFHRPDDGHISLVTAHQDTLFDHLGRYVAAS
jgi:pimeloyl-ACP methyl ester carboxylesterase